MEHEDERTRSCHVIHRDGNRTLDFSRESAEELLAAGGFFWLDLDRPDAADFEVLRDVFKFHPLALEDSENFGQRAKIDDYDDFAFLVVYGASPDEDRLVEVHCFYSEKYLITVHRDEAPAFTDVRDRFAKRAQPIEHGARLLYQIVEALVAEGGYFWLDLDQPDAEDFEVLREVFKFHPLAIEDSEHFGQRAKIDDYDDFVFIVVYGAAPDEDRLVEVHCFYSERFLVTVHRDDCPAFVEIRNRKVAVVYTRKPDPTAPVLYLADGVDIPEGCSFVDEGYLVFRKEGDRWVQRERSDVLKSRILEKYPDGLVKGGSVDLGGNFSIGSVKLGFQFRGSEATYYTLLKNGKPAVIWNAEPCPIP